MKITYELAMSAGRDAGNRHAKKHGRTVWNQADWDVACIVTTRLMNGATWALSQEPDGVVMPLEATDPSHRR